ncbi:tRNA uridine-5-carboxymethylaminomethyl(34) synthesis GTPase MnmE [Frateuria sp. STR12]|uniref:tRNA uridine-5-carboxymethylaminomethyl(34) synthesis GTPase MnmE n=1 Tax=Frateuria hangzhouensis TaxID=2995589 RepID=UPI0022609BB3|nr:tRNA uridine-5-carboxymethylaminomethyl(34) synthesis GTPase MnmE [Frateuria sp. STR12]MCX7513343.1 tRNA uridine-5-carboxymethylaminomethyl(34) synthesis GTPase MnmE [Frateuria sp. STR12]
MADTDTIAAIASAPGAAGIGVVRVSGPHVPAIAQALLGRAPQPRHAHLAVFHDDDGSLIDHGLLLHFPAPHSYTGEHVLELQGHGSAVLLDLLLRRVCVLGARLARPGEFTERAFLNGKLDLAQAEAVADLIAARSEAGARAALRSLDGAFSQRVQALLDALVALRVHVEAAIDFPEEEIDFLADPAIARQLQALRTQLADLLVETRRGVRLTDGLKVAIVGRPNAGKSSLLNALAQSERAIVTPIAGTTRDVLRETVSLDGVVLELADTAGLRDTQDEVEREGVRRARGELARADLVLLVTEAAHRVADLHLLAELPANVACLVLVNKIDLDAAAPTELSHAGVDHLRISARTGAGLDGLRTELRARAGAGSGEGAFSARRRHVLALEHVQAHFEHAAGALAASAGELAAEDLRQAQHALGEITGSYTSDDLLGAIFGSFCIGK